MPAELILQQTPDTITLLARREHLATLRATLAEREAALAGIRTRVKVFEARYLQLVGILYAELDDLEARICEREIDLYDSEAAQRRAREARERARETHEAAYSAAHEPEEFDPPPNLKTLFRELARRIHPDFARDESEANHFTLLMARANHAYSRGDTETLERLLDDYREVHSAAQDEGPAAELLRIARQIGHADRDLAALTAEQDLLLGSEIGLLHLDAEAATLSGRDLLAELAESLQAQVADAQYRLAFVDRQVAALER